MTGARSCIGRRYEVSNAPQSKKRTHTSSHRFSETESVAIIAVLLARYKIEVKEEPQFANETLEQRRERILDATPGITLTYAAFHS